MVSFPVAIVTGATKGIGKAIVQELSAQGFCCVMVGSQLTSFKNIKENPPLLKYRQQWHRGVAIDLGSWPQWIDLSKYPGFEIHGSAENLIYQESTSLSLHDYKMWQTQNNTKYHLDLLVNCAGVTQTSVSMRTPVDEMQQILNVNLMSAISMCNIVARRLIRNKKNWGSNSPCIVNVSSVLGKQDGPIIPGTSIYSASKAALQSYSRVLSSELAHIGIRVECVCPELVPGTSMIQQLDPKTQSELELQLKDRLASTPADIASQVWQLYNKDGSSP